MHETEGRRKPITATSMWLRLVAMQHTATRIVVDFSCVFAANGQRLANRRIVSFRLPQDNILVDDFEAINALRHKSGAGQHQANSISIVAHNYFTLSSLLLFRCRNYEIAPVLFSVEESNKKKKTETFQMILFSPNSINFKKMKSQNLYGAFWHFCTDLLGAHRYTQFFFCSLSFAIMNVFSRRAYNLQLNH